MTRFKKIAPLILAAAFTFSSAAAFSQARSTGVAECDQFVTAYLTSMMKKDIKDLPAKKQDEWIRVMDDILGLSDDIRRSLENGKRTRQETVNDCKKALSKLKSEAGVN